jgi:hypothetical protein
VIGQPIPLNDHRISGWIQVGFCGCERNLELKVQCRNGIVRCVNKRILPLSRRVHWELIIVLKLESRLSQLEGDYQFLAIDAGRMCLVKPLAGLIYVGHGGGLTNSRGDADFYRYRQRCVRSEKTAIDHEDLRPVIFWPEGDFESRKSRRILGRDGHGQDRQAEH